jgi:PKD repeat protein
MANNRVSSLDSGYTSGDLSLFPEALDDKDSLYEVKNNAETILRSGLSYNGKKMIVESTASFPNSGLLRVGPPAGREGDAEIIYYGSKTSDTFKNIIRGFSASKQNQWPAGSWVINSVMAEHHNAVKDALIKIQRELGVKDNPSNGSLNRRLKDLELKFLSAKASFRAFPRRARPGQTIRFQSFCEGDIVRYLWDFGDGGQSVQQNPDYTFAREGTYTVKLHLITSSGGQGISTKENYITISKNETKSFFYAKKLGPKTYQFIDQTDGDILQRFWVFGDGTNYVETDKNKHFVTHEYAEVGSYEPSLLVAFAGDSVKRVFLKEKVEVT